MLPSRTPLVSAGRDRAHPVVEGEASADWSLSWKQLGGVVVTRVVVVVDDGRHGRVEDGEHAQRGADAIGTVPERRGGEEVRREQAEVVRIPQGGEERRGGAEYAVAVC